MTARIHPLRPKRDQRNDFEKLRRQWKKEKLDQESEPLARVPGLGAISASLVLWAILVGAAMVVASCLGWHWENG